MTAEGTATPLSTLLGAIPDDASLSLCQLVSVHNALLRTSSIAPTASKSSCSSDENTSLTTEDVVHALVRNDQEVEICLAALQGTYLPSARSSTSDDDRLRGARSLFVTQYLLCLNSQNEEGNVSNTSSRESTSRILGGLKNVILPLLLRPSISSSPMIQRDVRDAVIDAAFGTESCATANTVVSDQTDDDISVLLERCVNDCVQSVQSGLGKEGQRMLVETSAKLLERLLILAQSNPSLEEEVVYQAQHEVVLEVARSICSQGDLRLLRPLTGLLLPLLWDGDIRSNPSAMRKQRALELWMFLEDIIDKDPATEDRGDNKKRCRNWNDVAPMIATGILCASIRGIATCTVSGDIPISRSASLWEFIKVTLCRMGDGIGQQSGMKTGGSFASTGLAADVDASQIDQILRRRAIHIFNLLVDCESKTKDADRTLILTWKKYVAVFEALEMENELHLVEQVWGTTTELCCACAKNEALINATSTEIDSNTNGQRKSIPDMSWAWLEPLFARVLQSDSPTVKKLSLYRLFRGDAGVSVSAKKYMPEQVPEASSEKDDDKVGTQLKKGKKDTKKKKAKKPSKKTIAEPARLSIISPSFVLKILLPSYESCVGTNINMDIDGKGMHSIDINEQLSHFLSSYIGILEEDKPEMTAHFFAGILSQDFIASLRHRPLSIIYEAVSDACERMDSRLVLPSGVIMQATSALKESFATGGVWPLYREIIIACFANILSHSSSIDQANPSLVLGVLELYRSPIRIIEEEEEDHQTSKNIDYYRAMSSKYLEVWVGRIGGERDWASEAAASCASAYISGHLLPFHDAFPNGSRLYVGKQERILGASIVKLCALAGRKSVKKAASEMLWPSISKGLTQGEIFFANDDASKSIDMQMPSDTKAKVARALVLLDHGCIERVVNGMGHGDLVVDKRGSMLPPPVEIERLLSISFGVIASQISLIVSGKGEAELEQSQRKDANTGPRVATRSRVTGELSSGLAKWCDLLKTFCDAFPSSLVLEQKANDLLRKSLDEFMAQSNNTGSEAPATNVLQKAHLMALTFASVSCGGELSTSTSSGSNITGMGRRNVTEICEFVISADFVIPSGDLDSGLSIMMLKSARSLFQYAKWGALSYLVPMAHANIKDLDIVQSREFNGFVFQAAVDAVQATPEIALLPLFETSLGAARLAVESQQQMGGSMSGQSLISYSKYIQKIVDSLFGVLAETIHGPTRIYMINSVCALLFRPRLLMDEYTTNIESGIADDGSNETWVIRHAFQILLKMSVRKPHIAKSAISYISAAWLGMDNEEGHETKGLSAVPYRQLVSKIFRFKEDRVDEAAKFQNIPIASSGSNIEVLEDADALSVPSGTNELSLVRGFLIVFFSKLPSPENGLDSRVLTDLCHFVIIDLLNSLAAVDAKGASSSFITGTPEYCNKIRGWQALCILQRFVTADIAEEVTDKLYIAMEQNLHGQIRYFQEIFALQCFRKHPLVSLQRFQSEVRRTDLSQQHVASLMIIIGNLTVGRYAQEFFDSFPAEKLKEPLHNILAGVLPWLSSTQGFARAIAQLLVHKLTPVVVERDGELGATNWYLQSIYKFLDEAPDMARLRKKQSKFFDAYDADPVCTPEGMLAIPVDVGNEANPVHMVNAVKQTLEEVYSEAHEADAPQWKQLKNALEDIDGNITADEDEDDVEALIGFQRKIVPLDSLNLSLEESREQSLRNAAGRRRQELIVCATFVDKIPNLAGLARTAEIFAADRLVIPDKRVIKQDNFKSISVTAGDWIPIDEVKEDDLMKWLKEKKNEGYDIVGLEQTSSSTCLSKHKFASKTVLLLGKEKEGIPVEYLTSLVDTCLEIPQLGVIRSLNVHVSGAICTWEYTKQHI